MEDTDISNLSLQEAREYVLAFLTTLKQTTRQREQVTQEIESWRARIKLAEERGATDLAARATAEVTRLAAKESTLRAEEEDLERKIDILKGKLKHLEITGERLVDTDLLQAELEMAVGEDTIKAQKTDAAINDAQAQAALEALKKKLGGGA